jgi:hypothetical protein
LQIRIGFEINVHMLELMGRCPDCRGTRAPKRKTRRRVA